MSFGTEPPAPVVDDNPIVHEEYWQGSKRFYICFAGIRGGVGMSQLDFSRSAGILDSSRIFLRDPNTAWYQHGLPGIGENIHDIARYLEGKIAQSGASEVRFFGNCMGGYAAILCCALIGRGRAVAFAPQTGVISSDERHHLTARLFDKQKPEHIYNLAEWLARNAPDVQADIHVARDYDLDVAHAKALEGFRNIRIHYYEKGGHRVIIHAHQMGLLRGIMAQ